MSGTLAVTGITTSLAALTQLVKDREHQVDQDLYLSDQGKWRLPFSYLTSAIIISFFMQVLMYVLMCGYFREVPTLSLLPEVLLIMLLSSLLSSLVNAIFVLLFPIRRQSWEVFDHSGDSFWFFGRNLCTFGRFT